MTPSCDPSPSSAWIWSPWRPTTTTRSVTPARARLRMGKWIIGSSNRSSTCLFTTVVIGARRVPSPPASTTPFTARPPGSVEPTGASLPEARPARAHGRRSSTLDCRPRRGRAELGRRDPLAPDGRRRARPGRPTCRARRRRSRARSRSSPPRPGERARAARSPAHVGRPRWSSTTRSGLPARSAARIERMKLRPSPYTQAVRTTRFPGRCEHRPLGLRAWSARRRRAARSDRPRRTAPRRSPSKT